MGYVHNIIKKKAAIDQERHQILSAGEDMLIHGRTNTEKILKQAALSLMWSNLDVHNILSPAKQKQVAMLPEMDQLQTTMITASMSDNVRS